MENSQQIAHYADVLEGILCKYLRCDYHDFGVKSNNNLLKYDWMSPVYFALGCRYGLSGRNKDEKVFLSDFLGNEFLGKSINDVIVNYDSYGFDNEDEACEYIVAIIKRLQELLKN